MNQGAKTALIFPGQGAHRPEMLDYAATLPGWSDIRKALTEAVGFDPVQRVVDEGINALNRNEVSSLLTVAVSIACMQELRETNLTCDYMAGYSVGQYTALYAAGVLNIQETLSLVSDRARLMDQTRAGTDGAMIAVIGLPEKVVVEACCQISTLDNPVSVANYNSLGQLTVAGTRKAITEVTTLLRAHNPLRLTPLAVSGAWHCELLRPVVPELLTRLGKSPLKLPIVPVLDNTTALSFPPDIDTLRHSLASHVASPVYWYQGINGLVAGGIGRFVEVGFGDMLTRFGFFIDRNQQHVSWKELV